jgi:hypothetical protein
MYVDNEQTDILQWWQANIPRFPRLSAMATDFCAAPATSVPSEEIFSTAGDLNTKKRNRMAPETAEIRMCARYWLQFPELTDDDWAESKRKEQALLARLEAQKARWHGQSNATGGSTDEGDHEDEDGDGHVNAEGSGAGSEDIGSAGGGGSGGGSGRRTRDRGFGNGLESGRCSAGSRVESYPLSEISGDE